MAQVKTAKEMFYSVEDVMRMLDYSRSKSYKIIASLNRELEARGVCVRGGRVSQKYFDQRYGLAEQAPAKAGSRASA